MKTLVSFPKPGRSWYRWAFLLAVSMLGWTVCTPALGSTGPDKNPAKTSAGKSSTPKAQLAKTVAAKSSSSRVTVTGSLIPQSQAEPGKIPATTSPVAVISSKDIQRSGASSLSQVLKRSVAGAR